MAQLLYRLGIGSARRPFVAIIAWLAALAVAVGGFLAFGGTLSSAVDIPNTPTAQLTERLQQEFPDAAKGSGNVVFATDDGKPFTRAQRQQIAELMEDVADAQSVDETQSPFALQKQLDDARTQVVEGRRQLEDGQRRLEEGRQQLADGKAELAAGEQRIEQNQARLDAAKAELDAAAPQITAGRQQLDAAKAELDAGRAQLDATARQLQAGQEQLDAAAQQAAAQLEAQQAELDAGRRQYEQAEARWQDGSARHEQGLAQWQAGKDRYDQGLAQWQAGQRQLEAGRQQLDAGRAELAQAERDLAAGEQEIERNRPQLERGERSVALTEGFRAVSEQGDVAVGRVVFDRPTMDLETSQKEEVTALLAAADIDGVSVYPDQQISATVPQVLGPAEVVGLVVAAVVLVVMLGTLAAAGLPLLNALVGVGVGVAGALAFSGAVEMMSVTPVLGIMLGLAVGIDYALFIVNRHRQQLKAGMGVRESIGLANGTSGNAVVFAGLTVIIALAALNVTGIPFLGLMGTVAAACVAIAVLIAVTLTPALLSLIGAKALTGKERARVEAGQMQPLHAEPPARDGRPRRRTLSTGGAVLTAVAAMAALVLIALPFGSLRLGLPDGGSEPVGSDAERAYTLTGEGFGDGYNGPLAVTADLPAGLDEAQATDLQLEVAEQLAGLDHVRAAVPAALNEDRTLAMVQVIPEEGPNAVSTEQLVQTLRSTEAAGEATGLDVAGVTSGFIDVSAKLSEALPLYLALVVGLSLVIMVLVFRSLLVPLIATGGFILSVFAAMGAVVAIYQWGWLGSVFGVHNPGPVLSFLPTIMIGVLFGLAMDYQLFIASGMREAYAHGAPAREAVLSGLRAGRAVVIAAAIIMVSVFGGFIFAHDAMIRPIGFGLTVGVLFDAFVVRLLLMPAVMHLLGPAAWWLPGWLERILPDVDVEGAALEREHPAAPAAH